MSNPKPLQFAAALQALGFLAALLLPLAATDFRAPKKFSPQENRELAQFPAWKDESLDSFPSKFEEAFNDRFGFRALFTRWHSLFKVYGMGMSPVEKVVIGKNEWLYLSESIKDYLNLKPLPKAMIAQWVQALKSKQAWLAERNIRYLLVVAPNKEDVYPEYLPNSVRRKRDRRCLDDILNNLGADSGVEVLDLREPLRNTKNLGLVYDRTDTHWSQLGAFLATNEILLRLQKWHPGLKPVPLAQRTLTPRWGTGGDLAVIMGFGDKIREERLVVGPGLVPFEPAPLKFQNEWPQGSLMEPSQIFETRNAENNLTLLITGDSFGTGLLKFLPEHFRRTVRIRPAIPYSVWFQELLPRLVDAEKPDIYVDILCARHLRMPPPAPNEKP